MTDNWVDAAIGHAVKRVHGIGNVVTDFPHITERREWRTTPDGVWTGGFWAGLLWLSYEQDKDEQTLEAAVSYTDRLLARVNDTHNHDLGFMFFPSAIEGWKVMGDVAYRDAAVQAAKSLAGQFNADAGFIPGWGFFGGVDWSGSVLIDTLMNLPLLVWAVQQGADPNLMTVVERHTATALAHHLREDGSVFHVFKFDPATGRPIGGDTYQGLAPDSSWARGQAWAITGLANLAAMTGNATYLQASQRVADYFIGKLPADGVPPWDFMATGPNEPKDASASAIASYGLIKLHKITSDERHLKRATQLLQALAETCGNRGDEGGVLLHSTADLPHGLGIDESTIYGDYYYLKSLVALKRATNHA